MCLSQITKSMLWDLAVLTLRLSSLFTIYMYTNSICIHVYSILYAHVYIYIYTYAHTHYSIVYVYCILYAIYIYISGISFESFMLWEEWVGLCWRKGDLRRGGMTSCQLHGKEPFASSHFLGLPWDCPSTALFSVSSYFESLIQGKTWSPIHSCFRDLTCPVVSYPMGFLSSQGPVSIMGLPADLCRKGLDL